MAEKANKVKFNLKNTHYALLTIGEDGTPTFGTPVPMPGSVSISLDANGEPENFYADGGVYYVINNNCGYDGDLELALIPGTYRIITTNRLPNGNQFAWEKTFTIKEGGQREETLRLREAQLGDMLERISLPEFEVKDSAGNTVTCAELTKGGKKILMWLEESREPTEHILNEMLEHAEKFHEFENSISFMIRTPEAKQDPLLAKVLKMFPNVSIYYDSFEENIELLGRRMYVDPDKLPLILVTNGESVGIYATSGYNVGTGDMLIRIMEEVPEV